MVGEKTNSWETTVFNGNEGSFLFLERLSLHNSLQSLKCSEKENTAFKNKRQALEIVWGMIYQNT